MTKNVIPFLFIIVSVGLNAQITLTSATSSPQIGDSFDYIYIPNYAFDVSQSGENQSWDFSTASGSGITINFIDVINSNEPSTYPNATVVATQTIEGVFGETYYSGSSSEFSIEGQYSPGTVRTIFTDKQEFLKFPITYNDIFNETFAGTVENFVSSQTFNRTGTIEIEGNGFGSLILPYTTVENVLKVKITYTYNDEFIGIPIGPYIQIVNLWFNLHTKFIIASASDSFFQGNLVDKQALYITESDLVLGLKDPQFSNALSIFPNPANDYAFLNNSLNETIEVNIYNTQGLLVKSQNIGHGKNKINTSNLSSGVYFVRYHKKSQNYTKKLVVN